MRHLVLAALAIFLAGTVCSAPVASPPDYAVVHDWPKVPDNEMLDEVSAVAVSPQHEVLVLTRAGRKWPENDQLDTSLIKKATIWVFDSRTGNLIRSLGSDMLAMPHGLTVDSAGNVWVTDVALHQVFKFSGDGKLLFVLGERAIAGDDEHHFNRPTDVAVAPDGSVFVSDGYGNNRVVEFDAAGQFVRQWGRKGSAPGQFNLPHAIAVDRQGRVFVNDRGNNRIQCFDSDGKFLFEWRGPPFVGPQDVKVTPDGRVYVVQTGDEAPPDETGVLVLAADASVIERVGRYGNYDGQFVEPHWVAVDPNGDVYVADVTGRRVQKFVRN